MLKRDSAKLEMQKEIEKLRNQKKADMADFDFVVSEMKRLSSELDPRIIDAIRGGISELSYSLDWYDNQIGAYQEAIDAIDRSVAARKQKAEAKKLLAMAS